MAASDAPGEIVLKQRAEQLAQTLPPLMAEADRVAATVAQGVHGRRRVGMGESFWQFRRYQPGDAAHRIDWRQSAKTQKVFIRENEWEAAQSVYLWADASASMVYRSHLATVEKRERASLLLLALAALLLRGGERVALLGSNEGPRTGRAALTRMAERLSLGVEAQESLPRAARLPRFSQVVLVGDFLAPFEDLEGRIKDYAAQGVQGHLLHLLDPAEEDLPFHGRVRFEGMENDGEIIVGRVESLREAYRARMRARRERLRGLARRLGWTLASHRTDSPPQTALLALWRAVADEPMDRKW